MTTETEQAAYPCGHPRTSENSSLSAKRYPYCKTCKRESARSEPVFDAPDNRRFPECGHYRGRNTGMRIEIEGNQIVRKTFCRQCEHPEPTRARVTPTLETKAFCGHCKGGECDHAGACLAPVITPRHERFVASGVCACGSAWSVRWPSIIARESVELVSRNEMDRARALGQIKANRAA